MRTAIDKAAGLSLHENEAAVLCRRFGVSRLSIFGSAATEKFDPQQSDIDFLVEFHPETTNQFEAYFDLKE